MGRAGNDSVRLALAIALLCIVTGCRPAEPPPPNSRLPEPPSGPRLLFVSLAADDSFHKVGIVPFAEPNGPAFYTQLACERAYFASGRGVCLTSTVEGAKTLWWARLFDDRFVASETPIPLTGPPSRVRVSRDGRLAAATVFESGHSYSERGFSTKTTIFDMETARDLGDLEQFETWRDGSRFSRVDFNFWGVTFASDSDTFYATLDTGGVSYLVRGSVRARRMDVIYKGVECPSLSPDDTRIAFKKLVGARSLGWWQIAILALDTFAERPLTQETRSVDDQVEWLDDDRLVYHLTGGATAADLWSLRADDSTAPALLRSAAYSPATIR